MIGASAAISGTMAAAMRFAFQRGGPLGFWRVRVTAPPIACRRSRSLACCATRAFSSFLAVWFGINILFGLGSFPLTGMGEGQVVAWQAHIGGFLAGPDFISLVLIRLKMSRKRRQNRPTTTLVQRRIKQMRSCASCRAIFALDGTGTAAGSFSRPGVAGIRSRDRRLPCTSKIYWPPRRATWAATSSRSKSDGGSRGGGALVLAARRIGAALLHARGAGERLSGILSGTRSSCAPSPNTAPAPSNFGRPSDDPQRL